MLSSMTCLFAVHVMILHQHILDKRVLTSSYELPVQGSLEGWKYMVLNVKWGLV